MKQDDFKSALAGIEPEPGQKEKMLDTILDRKEKGINMKRKNMKLIPLVVGCLLMMSVAVLASDSTGFFKVFFGESVNIVAENIFSPQSQAENEDYRLVVEGVVSDEYSHVSVVSVEVLNEKAENVSKGDKDHFKILKGENAAESSSSSVMELESLKEKNKRYYILKYKSTDEILTEPLIVSFEKDGGQLSTQIPMADTLPAIEIRMDQNHYGHQAYRPQTVKISPLSIVVKGYEKEAKYQIPTPKIVATFDNGEKMNLLDNEFSASRFPEENITTATKVFDKIINIDKIASITVDGIEYQAGKDSSF